ncbi:hypothetical protein ACVW1C_000415 [Bradyrhizobium sp. USDA 4011]
MNGPGGAVPAGPYQPVQASLSTATRRTKSLGGLLLPQTGARRSHGKLKEINNVTSKYYLGRSIHHYWHRMHCDHFN